MESSGSLQQSTKSKKRLVVYGVRDFPAGCGCFASERSSLDREKLGRLSPKKQRVSCVRDFPLGCGPFAHLSNSEEPVEEFPVFDGDVDFQEAKNVSPEEKSVLDYEALSSPKKAKTSVEETQVEDKVLDTTEKKRPREEACDLSSEINQLDDESLDDLLHEDS